MSAIVSLISLICSLGASTIKSTAFHVIFIFLAFAIFAYTIVVNPTLNDIQVYSDSFRNIQSEELYFEYTFIFLLEFFQFLRFDVFYSISVALSASFTYWILCTKFKRPDNLQLVIFIILYTPQFSLAWRQLLATPAFTYIIINFMICNETSEKPKILKKVSAAFLSSFHNSTLISGALVLFFSRYNKVTAFFTVLIFGIIVYFSGYLEAIEFFLLEKSLIFAYQVEGASAYIDEAFTSSNRIFFVNLKFILLLFIFGLIYRTQGYPSGISVRILGMLCVFKVIISLLIWFIPSPAWGRINGLLVVVDYIVLMYGLKRYPVISFMYLLPTYVLGVTLHPYFR